MLQRARRAARIARAAYRDADIDFTYYPADEARGEFAELKRFMRKAFRVLQYNGIAGDYAEFGVWGARTFSLAYGAAQHVGYPARFWAFDSFRGLPEPGDERDAHRGWTAGAMAMTEERFREVCSQRGVPPEAYTTVPGFFSESLDAAADGQRPERVTFAYVDCDLYTSTVDVLRFLEPRIVNGTVMAFDDWFCNGQDGPSGERLAAKEFFDARPGWNLLPFVQYCWSGMSFILERT